MSIKWDKICSQNEWLSTTEQASNPYFPDGKISYFGNKLYSQLVRKSWDVGFNWTKSAAAGQRYRHLESSLLESQLVL